MNFYLKACLSSIRRISVMIFGASNRNEPYEFKLYKDGNFVEKLSIFKCSSQNNIFVYELEMSKDFEFGHEYSISASDFPMAVIDVTSVTEWKEFDEMFYYDGDDLGSTYSKEYTDFVLWAPLASLVLLKIENSKGEFEFHKLNREGKGIYRRRLLGDHLNQKYHYVITNSGVTLETNDPYGKGVSLNSEYSLVIDLSSLEDIKKITPKTLINSYNESIIYELNVRDFTEDSYTDIEAKGKYLGLAEENRKTRGGNPAGLDYLKYLEITTVQLQPVHDFRGVDDLNTSLSYNWGYDPLSYFALEGSYSINPSDAISRLKEFKIMISKLHENDIKVNMDVVFNHIYDYQNSYLERCVPNYYFRRRENGQIANASGCGNDLKTERKMLRKLIIDSLTYYIKIFDVDGFRFDLMGLIDAKTLNDAYAACKKIKPTIMFYGEGWDMCYELKKDEKGSANNYKNLPNIAFFNDTFRNVAIGSIFKDRIKDKGFVSGRIDNLKDIDYVFLGTCVSNTYDAKFDNANRSINYVECHDNFTLFDKLQIVHENEDIEDLLKRVKLANKFTMISFGIPFFHMGQEIGQSKNMQDNTYNIPKINNLDYRLVDERFEMVSYFKMLVSLRRKLEFLKIVEPKEIKKTVKVEHWNNNAICVECINENYFENYPHLLLLMNNENFNKNFELDDYYIILQGGKQSKQGDYFIKNNFIPRNAILVLYKKGDER